MTIEGVFEVFERTGVARTGLTEIHREPRHFVDKPAARGDADCRR
jgi:hypothetical protein